MIVELKNCNNIDSGTIEILSGQLNIKYAINGTGKSTIATAISKTVSGDSIDFLLPFKHRTHATDDCKPSVQIEGDIHKVAIFNENYIETYAYKKDELLQNSFEIFVKTPKYDEHMSKISELVDTIRQAFQNDPELEELINTFDSFISSFGKTKGGYSTASDLGKSLGQGNQLEHIPDDLSVYEPYIRNPTHNLKWLKWQSEGTTYLEIDEKCPFCVSDISTPKDTILKVSSEYEPRRFALLIKVLDVFELLKTYFPHETQEKVRIICSNPSSISKEQIEFLKRLKDEAITLRDKLIGLKNIGFFSLRETETVIDFLKSKQIDLSYFPNFDCDQTRAKVTRLNSSLEEVVKMAGKLQGEVNQQKREISKTIEQHSQDINSFLLTAGYQYEVSINPTGNNSYQLVLNYTGKSESINNVKEHLSFGERNAFALVLFMYHTLREDVDLIILDDPISSFDNNKKFAIMNMLFRGPKSFQGKTVLMLTHDFEPVIDVIGTLKHIFTPAPCAYLIANINGDLEEKRIESQHIMSCVSICKENILRSDSPIHKLIYYRRLLEINDNKNLEWDLVSNVFHKNRDIPKKRETDGSFRDMTREEIVLASEAVKEFIPDFDYAQVYSKVKDLQYLIQLYLSTSGGYEKVMIYRIMMDGELQKGSPLKKYVDETFHVQNDYLFQLNPRDFKLVPQYILDFCDSEIQKFVETVENYSV